MPLAEPQGLFALKGEQTNRPVEVTGVGWGMGERPAPVTIENPPSWGFFPGEGR